MASLRALHPYADYVAVNVSSPNTPGLRSLQDRGQLGGLLAALRAETAALGRGWAAARRRCWSRSHPISPSTPSGSCWRSADEHAVAGVIATNTTLTRTGVAPVDSARATETGGLSGRPLSARAVEVVRFVTAQTGGRLPVIGVGGILDPDDALRMRDAGASLVQLYTGLVYRGPGLVRRMNRVLRDAPVATPA